MTKNEAKECRHCTPQAKQGSASTLVNRINGQVSAIGRMIEEDRYCPDILNQIRAARSALRTLEGRILQTHMQTCVYEAFSSGDKKAQEGKIEEIVNLFKRYDEVSD